MEYEVSGGGLELEETSHASMEETSHASVEETSHASVEETGDTPVLQSQVIFHSSDTS